MTKPYNNITADYLRSLYLYEPETGLFRYLPAANIHKAGKIAGYKHSAGYVIIFIDKLQYRAHRLAWLYVTGNWPAKMLDHADRDKSNNRWANLREATPTLNMANRIALNPRSGFKGVVKERKATDRWRARIHVMGREIHLGMFASPEAAHAAYVKAATLYWGEFARVA